MTVSHSITRRQALSTIGVSSVEMAGVAAVAMVSLDLQQRIETHRAAYEAWLQLMRTPRPSKKVTAQTDAAGDREMDAARALLAFQCRTDADLAFRNSYLLDGGRNSPGRAIIETLDGGGEGYLTALLGA